MPVKTSTPLVLLFLSLFIGTTLGAYYTITSASKLIEISNNVNKDLINYYGTTIVFDSDLNFSGLTFEPIGKEPGYYLNGFNGSIDGRGYKISNLKISASSHFVGLVGYSTGSVIKNIVIDSSCSIEGTYKYTSSSSLPLGSYVGGIVGQCSTTDGPCKIENNVNMGNVSFSGNIKSYLNIGGIMSSIYRSSYEALIRNCANYGPVTDSGLTSGAYLGGIVGYSSGSSSASKKACIHNCFNYANVICKEVDSISISVSGIVGEGSYTDINNCVNFGKAFSLASVGHKGAISGYLVSQSSISYCYCNASTGSLCYGSLSSSTASNISNFNSNFELEKTISIGGYSKNSLIEALNAAADYYTLREYSKWVLNSDEYSLSFTIGNKKTFALSSKIILLPGLASEGTLWFYGWYTDSSYSTPLTSFTISTTTTIYGKFAENINSYTISFDTRGGTPVDSITNSFSSAVTLPSTSTMTGHKFSSWETEYGDSVDSNFVIPAHTITLYAAWKANQYTITFMNEGKVVKSNKLDYGSTITYPSNQTKTGHTFTGWNNSITIVPDYDVTIGAVFKINKYTISFETNGGSACGSITQDYGTPVTLPITTKEGHTFDFWCNDSDLTTQYTTATMPANDTVLYAKFTISQYTITFETNGGSSCDNITQDYDTPVTLPVTTKEGHTFDYWCNDPTLLTRYTESIISAENITLYAKFTINKYNITFIFDNGAEPEVRTLGFNEEIIYPNPLREGYSFNGWDNDTEYMPAGNFAVTAQWLINNYTVLFVIGDYSETKIFDYDSPVTYPKNVKKDGYTFNGWDKLISNMPAENITITAQWIEKPTKYVEIVFDKKDITEEEAEEILKSYTNEVFTIENIVVDSETGETKIIVKFADANKSEEFVRNINDNKRQKDSYVKRVMVTEIGHHSFSFTLTPLTFLNFVLP